MPAMPPTDAPEDSSLERVRPGRAALRTLLPRRGAAGGARRAPARSILTLAIVTGLVATVAIPAYAAWKPETEAKTLQQLAADGAQTLVVASDVGDSTLARGSYSATTPEEIAKKKAAEAAAARAKAALSGGSVTVDLASIPAGSGAIGWPLRNISNISDRFGARGGSHKGVDMLAPAMSPVYASADGVVSQSTEGGSGGYGAYIRIEHVIDGVRVSTLYAHLSYGTRTVEAGQTVSRGQVIGGVGRTGYATANHVHFEVFVNNAKVDPMPWLGPYGT
ncbi:MAG: M23 family metallopeptidase [Microbacterium sp.]|uniref:M23 family metallopeptidase n=1 Tax=Microbacterium sp. TaxID=51671 RepID=UPI002721755F|nr:M23 family metallopeptidase [Microbacterium sp.]MDO8382618.1 M23 family metallopeptidase [Microbacterium sp.]